MPVAIALADDSLIVREGVAQILSAQPEIEVVASRGVRRPPTSIDDGIRRGAALLREEHADTQTSP